MFENRVLGLELLDYLLYTVYKELQGWRDASVFKSTGCPFRGPGFNSWDSHSNSKLS